MAEILSANLAEAHSNRDNALADYALLWLALNAPNDVTVIALHRTVRNFVEFDRAKLRGGGWDSCNPGVSWRTFLRVTIGGPACLPFYLRLLS